MEFHIIVVTWLLPYWGCRSFPFSCQALAQKEAEAEALRGPASINPNTDYKDKYSHLIGKSAAKDAAQILQANKA